MGQIEDDAAHRWIFLGYRSRLLPIGDVVVGRKPPPEYKPMARTESDADADAPRHPGGLWDYILERGLDPNDPDYR
jgi:hypothetical protein